MWHRDGHSLACGRVGVRTVERGGVTEATSAGMRAWEEGRCEQETTGARADAVGGRVEEGRRCGWLGIGIVGSRHGAWARRPRGDGMLVMYTVDGWR
jgi:hypothetical protein